VLPLTAWHAAAPPVLLQQFEKNVRKGQLTDATIGLWDTAALQVGSNCGSCEAVWWYGLVDKVIALHTHVPPLLHAQSVE
jgi:hypothetical protein